jgi:hypothetical protein
MQKPAFSNWSVSEPWGDMRCIVNERLGLYCPGCGSMRAIAAFIDGDFVGAFLYNPFLFTVFIPLIIYIGVMCTRLFIMRRASPSALSSPKVTIAVVVVVISVWIFRNIFPLGLAE